MTAGRTPIRLTTLRPMRDGAIVACVVLALAHFMGIVATGVDAHSYWASNPFDPYGAIRPGQQDAYFYAPVFTQLLGPLHLLPWPVFIGLWTLLLSAALVWMTGLWAGFAILFVPVFVDLSVGNIHLLLAAAVVGGFRWPWLWSFPLLTKVTPGVGLLWFVVRREWRNLGMAIGATALVSVVSFVVAPGLWFQWVGTLSGAVGQPDHAFIVPVPIAVRLIPAAGLVIWGARTDRRWTVVVAAMLALPILWINGLAMLVGVLALVPDAMGATPAARWLASLGRRSRTSADG
ncbi:MAG: glycosyltransferase family 87 protein [Chloroflexota bacterium]